MEKQEELVRGCVVTMNAAALAVFVFVFLPGWAVMTVLCLGMAQ